jgi:type II secretory pathway predicted ATPase ExeA
MYRQHFGLKHAPLEKESTIVSRQTTEPLKQRFEWLLSSPGIGLLTGEPGVGKTSALKLLTDTVNPQQYQVIYAPDTDFSRLDIYRNLAQEFGLEPAYRRGQLWREMKQYIKEMVEQRGIYPVWIIDEAQNLPYEFFRDLPSFLNFGFDSKSYMVIWLVGTTGLELQLSRSVYEALNSRICVKVVLDPMHDLSQFKQMIEQSFKDAGVQQQLIASSGMALLCSAAKGNPRKAGRIIKLSMQMAAAQGLNHLPDELLQQAIDELQLAKKHQSFNNLGENK